MIPRILLACSSGLFLILVFPKLSCAILAWIALLPLFLALHRQGLLLSFALGFVTGVIGIMGIFYWITLPAGVHVRDFLMMVAYGGLYFGGFAAMLNFLVARTFLPLWVLAPFLWVTLEYIRSHFFFLEIPWALLGHSQYQNLPLIQLSEFTGVYGISFLIVLANAALYEAWQSLGAVVKPAVISLGLVAVAWVYGWSILQTAPEFQRAQVTVIQGNIPQDIKWDPASQQQSLLRHIHLTEEALQGNSPALIVWPETAVPGALRKDGKPLETLSTLAKSTKTFLVIGTAERPKFLEKHLSTKNRFNSALLISPLTDQIEQRYHKIKLLPFKEYLPYKDLFPWPRRFLSEAGNFLPGKEYTVFNIPGLNGHAPLKFSVLICWETIFSNLVRQFVLRGATFVIDIANEAWFGKSAAPYQFLSMNVFRAVENRRSIVRATNSGVSGFIDPYGRILGQVEDNHQDIFVAGHLTKAIPLLHHTTFYTHYGDLFAQTASGVFILFLLYAIRPRGRLVTTVA